MDRAPAQIALRQSSRVTFLPANDDRCIGLCQVPVSMAKWLSHESASRLRARFLRL